MKKNTDKWINTLVALKIILYEIVARTPRGLALEGISYIDKLYLQSKLTYDERKNLLEIKKALQELINLKDAIVNHRDYIKSLVQKYG